MSTLRRIVGARGQPFAARTSRASGWAAARSRVLAVIAHRPTETPLCLADLVLDRVLVHHQLFGGRLVAAPASRKTSKVPRKRASCSPRRSPRRSRASLLRRAAAYRAAQAPCLSFCLVHPSPGPFTSDRTSHVRAGHGRWRTVVNAGQHCWKACWGQPLRSSNLLSSATLTCNNTGECLLPSGLMVSSGLINGLISPAVDPAAAHICRRGGPGQRQHGRP